MRDRQNRWGAKLERVGDGYRPPGGRSRRNKGRRGCNALLHVEDARMRLVATLPVRTNSTSLVKVYLKGFEATGIDLDGALVPMDPVTPWETWEGVFRHHFHENEIAAGPEYLMGILMWVADDHLRAGTLDTDPPF